MVSCPPWQGWLAAALTAFLCAWAVRHAVVAAWVPVLEAAADALPETGRLHHGALELNSPETASLLAANPHLSVGLHGEPGDLEAPSDIRLVLSSYGFRVCSLFGCTGMAYPIDLQFPANRVETTAWWGAWRPFLLGLVYCAAVLFFLVQWCLIATVLLAPALGLAWYLDRTLGVRAAFRLAVICQLPGALVFSVGLVLHVTGFLGLLELTVLAALQCLAGVALLFWSLWHLPRLQEQPVNPFATESSPKRQPAPEKNPFAE